MNSLFGAPPANMGMGMGMGMGSVSTGMPNMMAAPVAAPAPPSLETLMVPIETFKPGAWRVTPLAMFTPPPPARASLVLVCGLCNGAQSRRPYRPCDPTPRADTLLCLFGVGCIADV